MAELKYHLKNDLYQCPDNLAKLLDLAADLYPDRPGLAAPGQAMTFLEYQDRVSRTVNALMKAGLKPNDRVVFISFNTIDYPLVALAVFRIGAVLVPLNPKIRHYELAHILDETRPQFLICRRDNLPSAEKAFELIHDFTSPVIITIDEKAPSLPFIGDLDYSTASSYSEEINPNDTAMIVYTAAMEGYPLGAQLSHANIFYDAVFFAKEAFGHRDPGSDVVACILPLFHCYGFTDGFLMPLAGFATCLVVDMSLRGRQIIEVLDAYKATQIISVPAIFYSILKHLPEKLDICSRLHNLTSGGIGAPMDLLERYHKQVGLDISEGYGLTECAPVITWNGLSNPPKFGSVGYPLACCQVKIVDDTGKGLPVGEEGEVLTRGPNIFSGYLNQPEHTKKAFLDGWFRTGDLGWIDNENYLTLTGVKKDMINVFGLKVYPKEVERILSFHPDVEQIRITRDWHSSLGEIAACEIMVSQGKNLNEKDFIKWCRQNISPYKIPRKVVIRS